MKTIRLTMGQALLKFLDNQYISLDGKEYKFVNGVIGIFGHGIVTGLGQALEQYKDGLRYYRVSNEQGAVHMATAYAKQKNRLQIMACTSSIGPGALNMVTGAATATVNRIPVLLLPGDTFACRQPDPVLQQIEFPVDYNVTANDAFKPVSKYWDRISRPEQLMTAAMNAMRVLTDPADTGAVTLAIPQDVQAEAYDYPEEFLKKRVHYIERIPLSRDLCGRLVQKISGKRKPMLICGGGVHYSLAARELAEFAEAFNIPVVETQAGKSALPWDHRLNLGGMGVTGAESANLLAKEADLVIGVGTRFTDFTTCSKTAFKNPKAEFISINVCKMDAIKMNALPVAADAREALAALKNGLLNDGYKSSYDNAYLAGLKENWDKEVDRLYTMDHPDGLSQSRALGEINKYTNETDIAVGSSGSLPGCMQRLWRSKLPKTYHMEYGFSCMGYEVAGALGAKMAEPDREVYSMVGDGSYLMLHSELLASIQEGYKINVMLFDNSGFACIKSLQMSKGSEGFGNDLRFRSEETGLLSGKCIPVDFAGYARAIGAKAYTVHTVEELKDALEKARKEKTSTLIDIKTVPGTHTGGYESWWRVGVAEVSEMEKVREAYEDLQEHVKIARKM